MDGHLHFLRGYGRAAWAHRHGLVVTFGILVALTLASATLIHFIERDGNPPFRSFWGCVYWAVVTLTTVGYGDMVPKSPPGQLVAVLTALVGVGFLLITAGVLSVAVAQKMEILSQPCPHCGKR